MPDTTVYSDEATAYSGLPRDHESVKHSVGEYVRDQVHINGMESFWSLLKRGYYGTHHYISKNIFSDMCLNLHQDKMFGNTILKILCELSLKEWLENICHTRS